MKSKFENRETLGTQLANTKNEHLTGDLIEDGDMIGEMGKSYMRELIAAAEDPEMPERFYILVVWEKMPVSKDRALSFVFVKRKTIPPMEPATDVYYIDKHAGHIELLWSLPTYAYMPNVLNNPGGYDPQTVFSVQKYKELEAKSKRHHLIA